MSFLVADDKQIQYEEFVALVKKSAASIQQLTARRNVVLIAKRTSIEQLAAFAGAMIADRIPIIIPHPSQKVTKEYFDEKMNKITEAVNPSLCICDEQDIDTYSKFWPAISELPHTDKELEPATSNENDVAFIQLSSGTTGVPKVVSISHKAIIAQCDEYANAIGINDSDVIVSWLPLYHDMGLVACFMLPLLKKISMVHISPFTWLSNPKSLFDAVEKYNGTHVWMPNFAFAYCVRRIVPPVNISSIKNWISCSEITNAATITKFSDQFQISLDKISNCYALAENVFVVSQSKGIKVNSQEHVSCGELIPGTSVLIDPETKAVLIKSSYTAEDLELSDWGYYNTGDVGYFENNELYIVGRADDMIIFQGKNISPYPIEDFVSNIDGVIPGRVACFGALNPVTGTQEIHIVAESHQNLTNKIYTAVTAAFEISTHVHIVEPNTIIKTSSGKINRKATMDKVLSNHVG